jgi:exopolysaccharide production protein ExoZ
MFALLVAPIAQLERRGFVVPRALLLLGAASYSIYLIHTPLISASARLMRAGWLVLFLSIALSIAAGLAYHFVVEQRAVRRRANPEVFAGAVKAAG